QPSLFDRQFQLMRKIVDDKFDVYGYCTFTATSDALIREKMRVFVDKLQSEVHENFPLRTIPLEIVAYTPTKKRMAEEHNRSIQIQEVAIEVWNEEIVKRFSADTRAKKIFEHRLH